MPGLTRRSLVLAAVSLACGRRRTAVFAGYAFVANRSGRAVAAVDLSAFAVARHFPLRGEPTAVLAHPSQPAVYALTPDTGLLHEIQSADLHPGRNLDLEASPSMARFRPPAYDDLWILAPAQRQLIPVSVASLRPGRRAVLPAEPVDFDIALSGTVSEGLAAVSLGESGEIALVGLDSAQVRKVVRLGGRLGRLRFRKDGKLLLIASLDDRQLLIYDVVRERLAVRLPLAVRPERFCMKPDGGQLFITGEGMDAVVTVHPYETDVAGTMLAGRAPGFVGISSNPDYLFVANPESSDVTIINIATERVMAVAPVGKEPCYIAITPDSTYALVLNRASGDIAVLHIATLSADRNKSAPLFTMIPVGSEPISAVIPALSV